MEPINAAQALGRIAAHRERATERKKRMQSEEARYTTVFHSARKNLDISVSDYCLADTINKLSGPRSPVPGWCIQTKEKLGHGLGFTREGVHKMIKRLEQKGLVEVQPGTGHLRTTERWHETIEVIRSWAFRD